MTNKKDFLSSLANELEDEAKGIENNDFDIYKETNKKGDELRNYKDLDYDFNKTKSSEKSPESKRATQPQKPTTPPLPTQKPVAKKATLRDGKEPHSFQEEKFQKIEKKPIKIHPGVIAGGIVALLAIIGAVWYFGFAPKIAMPNFVGQTINDVGAWAKQNEIPVSNIIMNSEFSLEYEKDVIISQDKEAGKKIKNSTPLSFVASKGANPEDAVDFPDIMNMTYAEVKDWIDTNKLAKTKISTQYNTIVEKDAVINYELKTGTESGFTRGATLTINVSKGPAPAGTVAMENFVGKTFAEFEQWATQKKLMVEKSEVYSDTVEIGKIISQNIKVGDSVDEGATVSVTVSKGKAVKIPNLVGYTKEMLEAWAAGPENKVTIIKKERYNQAAEGTVVDQSLKAGSAVDQGSVLELTISIYMPQLETNSRAWYGKDYLELIKWVDDANGKGASLAAGSWDGEEASDEYPTPGQIIEYRCLDGNGNQLSYGANGCARPLPLNAKIAMKISTGPKTPKPTATPSPELKSFTVDKNLGYAMFKALCEANGVTISTVGTIADDTQFAIFMSDGTTAIDTGKVLNEGDSVIVKNP